MKGVRLTKEGTARLQSAAPAWAEAQARFEGAFGTSDLRRALRNMVASAL